MPQYKIKVLKMCRTASVSPGNMLENTNSQAIPQIYCIDSEIGLSLREHHQPGLQTRLQDKLHLLFQPPHSLGYFVSTQKMKRKTKHIDKEDI